MHSGCKVFNEAICSNDCGTSPEIFCSMAIAESGKVENSFGSARMLE